MSSAMSASPYIVPPSLSKLIIPHPLITDSDMKSDEVMEKSTAGPSTTSLTQQQLTSRELASIFNFKPISSTFPSPPMPMINASPSPAPSYAWSTASYASSRSILTLTPKPPASPPQQLPPSKPKQSRSPRSNKLPKGPCHNCGIDKSPFWRRDPEGNFNCNACGLYRKHQNKPRPVSLNRAPRKRRSIESDKLAGRFALGHFRSQSACSDSVFSTYSEGGVSPDKVKLARRSSDGFDLLCSASAVADRSVDGGRVSPTSGVKLQLPRLRDFLGQYCL